MYTNFTQDIKELYLYINTSNSKYLRTNFDYYLYEANQIKEIEQNLINDYKPYEKSSYPKYITTDSIYSIIINRPEQKNKSAVTKIILGDCFLTFKANFNKKKTIIIKLNSSSTKKKFYHI